MNDLALKHFNFILAINMIYYVGTELVVEKIPHISTSLQPFFPRDTWEKQVSKYGLGRPGSFWDLFRKIPEVKTIS